MKNWPLVIAFLYAAAVVVFTLPVMVLCWLPQAQVGAAVGIFLQWWYWAWVGLMFLGQLALLAIPVDLSKRRSLRRRPILVPIALSGLMMAALAFGALCSLWEFHRLTGTFLGWPALAVAGCGWAVWTLVFFLLSRGRDSTTVAAEHSCSMLGGSILELLVAVPTHVLVRQRNECCAGFLTFFGIVLGVSVMLFAFGPAVFFLYLARWRRLQPRRVFAADPETDSARHYPSFPTDPTPPPPEAGQFFRDDLED